MLTQIDLDKLYTEVYNVIARSHGMSRREYIADFLIKSADKVPGLVDKIKRELGAGIKQDAEIELAPESDIFTPPPLKQRMKRYRFKPRDGGPAIEGIGVAAGDALTDATGRKWTQPEFAQVYFDPEMVGYVDEE